MLVWEEKKKPKLVQFIIAAAKRCKISGRDKGLSIGRASVSDPSQWK